MNGQENTQPPAQTQGSWIKDKVGKPLFWVGIGFLSCKLLEAYTEGKRTKRLSQ
jgi:hypothetical protein